MKNIRLFVADRAIRTLVTIAMVLSAVGIPITPSTALAASHVPTTDVGTTHSSQDTYKMDDPASQHLTKADYQGWLTGIINDASNLAS